MDILETFRDELLSLVPTAVALALASLAVYGVHRFLARRPTTSSGIRTRRQLIVLAVTAVGLLVVVFALPVDAERRGQFLGFLGILLSAALALSATTLLGNALAGLMLRIVRSFVVGDFVRVGETFGRVSECGIFHTEVQTEDRDLTTLPNLYFAMNPVTVVRASGTIVSATVSLGYDVSRRLVKEALLEAAESTGLKEPYVQLLELGDFTVTYRVAGLLTDVKALLSTRSGLRAAMLDALHGRGVEIVSPSFMNTRALEREQRFVPHVERSEERQEKSPEDIVFDKAEEASTLEGLRQRHEELVGRTAELERALKKAEGEAQREATSRELERVKSRRERLAELILRREEEAEASD